MAATRPSRALVAGAAALLAMLAAGATSSRADGPARDAARVVVVGEKGTLATSLSSCRALVEAELPILESMLPWRMRPDAQIVVRLCVDPEDYRRVVRSGGAGAFADHCAATVDMTGESVVVIQPRAEPEALALVRGLPALTRELVAHELFHQYALKAGVPVRPWWPDWYAEGMAEWTAEQTLRATTPPAEQPVLYFEDRAHQVLDALEHDRSLSLERLLHAEVLQFKPMGDLYAHAWSLIRFLARDAARFRALHTRMGSLPEPPQGDRSARRVAVAKAAAAALESAYGPLGALEARWRAAIRDEKPRFAIPSRSAERLGDGAILVTAFVDENAITVLTEPPPGDAFSFSGVVRVLSIGDRQADLILAFERRDSSRFLKLALGPGFVTLLAFADGAWQDRYRVNAAIASDEFPVDQALPFDLRVAGGRLELLVAGKRIFAADVPPGFDVARGLVGVGCHNGAVVFDALKTTTLETR